MPQSNNPPQRECCLEHLRGCPHARALQQMAIMHTGMCAGGMLLRPHTRLHVGDHLRALVVGTRLGGLCMRQPVRQHDIGGGSVQQLPGTCDLQGGSTRGSGGGRGRREEEGMRDGGLCAVAAAQLPATKRQPHLAGAGLRRPSRVSHRQRERHGKRSCCRTRSAACIALQVKLTRGALTQA